MGQASRFPRVGWSTLAARRASCSKTSSRRSGRWPGGFPRTRRRGGSEVARRYGVVHEVPRNFQQLCAGRLNLDLATFNGEWALPMPARFVIDRTGIVRSVETNPDYRARPDPASTLEALRRLPS